MRSGVRGGGEGWGMRGGGLRSNKMTLHGK